MSAVDIGLDLFRSSPLCSVFCNENYSFKSLRELMEFRVTEGSELSEVLPVNSGFKVIFEDSVTRGFLRQVAGEMYPDLDKDQYFAPYIPIAVLSDKTDFKLSGSVSIAEVFASFDGKDKRNSYDGVVLEDDFFCEGYNSCYQAYLQRLFRRCDLSQPVTRSELAYISIVCRGILGGLSANGMLGISFNWDYPTDLVSKYDDIKDYRIIKSQDEPVDIKSYFENGFLHDFCMLKGLDLPFPLLMSMLELGEFDIFKYNGVLSPFSEVTYGEFCYFIIKSAINNIR